MTPLAIGSHLWYFDGNSRYYDERRRIIHARCFREQEIVGETRLSWIAGPVGSTLAELGAWQTFKVNKKTLYARDRDRGCQFFTPEGMADDIYAHDRRPLVIEALRTADAETLKHIAAILAARSLKEPT